MKKLYVVIIIGSILILSSFLIFFLKNSKLNKQKSQIKIVTTLFPIYYFTENIVKGKMTVVLILPTGIDPHYFDPSPEILKEIKEADYIFYSNTYLDSWVKKIKNKFPHLKVISVVEGVNFINYQKEYDPHFWHSLIEDKKVVENIFKYVSFIDPSNKEFYQENYLSLVEKIDKLHQKNLRELANLKNRKIITKHNAFSYLARDYNLEIIGYLEKEEGELTLYEIKNLVELIKKHNVKVVFGESYSNNEKVYNFAKNLGLKVFLLHSLEKSYKDFFEAYEENIKIIKEALEK